MVLECYLDNSATTICHEGVKNIMVEAMTKDFGNPSSMHTKGVEAEKYIRDSKNIIAKSLKVNEKEIFFTSGGTESDNWALIGAAEANKRAGKHIITTVYEHPAILDTLKYLEEQGYEVSYIPVDNMGQVRLDILSDTLREDTILVTMMHVNNEIGAVLPLGEAAKIIKDYNPNIIFHVDAIQGFGKYQIYPKKLGIDMLSVSGHKIHGPKGVGFLYINEKIKIKPLIHGGGQQGGRRSGTENVPGIAGLGQAVKECYENFNEKVDKLYELRSFFIEGIKALEGTKINGYEDRTNAPHIVSVSFEGIRSEVLLHSLEDKGIYISAGSACASNKPAISATLKAIGIKNDLLDSTIRFSFSTDTTREELEYTLEALKGLLPMLRKYARH